MPIFGAVSGSQQPSRLRNIVWLLADRSLRLVLGLGSVLIIARYLGPEEYGLLALALSWAALFMVFADLGLFGLVVKELVTRETEAGKIIGTVLLSRSSAGLVMAVTAIMAAAYYHPNPAFVWLVAILTAGMTLRSFEALDLWFQAHEHAQQAARMRSLAAVCVALLRLLLVGLGAPLWSFAVAAAAEHVVLMLGLYLSYRRSALRRPAKWQASLAELQQLLSRSWPLMLSGVGVMIYLKIDQIMIGRWLGEEQVGIYALAAQVSEAGWFVPQAIVTAWFPALLLLRRDAQAAYAARLQQLYDGLFLLGMLLVVGVTLLGPLLLPWLLGPEYAPALGLLLIHIWSAVFIFMRALLSRWLIAEDLLPFSLLTHGLGALTNVLLNIWWIPRYGAAGAAWATVVAYFVASYLALWLHPRTWPAARMMSWALLAPLRLPLRLLRGQPV